MSIQHMPFISIVVGVVFLSIAAVAVILYVKQVRRGLMVIIVILTRSSVFIYELYSELVGIGASQMILCLNDAFL